jgi:hypothetical protein
MTGYARATLWIGLILIVLNLLSTGGWSNFWGIITSKGTTPSGSAKEAPDPSGTKALQTPAATAAGVNASKNTTTV